jgi:hypothetical protein
MNTSSDLTDSLVGHTLSTPLLSNLLEHEGDECDADYYDEEEGCMSCPHKIAISNTESDEVSGDASIQPSWWNGNCVAWVVLYALLFLQLGMVLCMSGAEATTMTGPHWPVVNYGIVSLSFGIANIYQEVKEDYKLTCLVVLLAAQILIIIILGDQSVATEAPVMMGLCRSLFIYVIVVFVGNATLYRQAIKDCKLTGTAVLLAPEILIIIILGLVVLDQLTAAFLFMLVCIQFFTIVVAVTSSDRGLIATSSPAKEDDCKRLQDKLDVSLFNRRSVRSKIQDPSL